MNRVLPRIGASFPDPCTICICMGRENGTIFLQIGHLTVFTMPTTYPDHLGLYMFFNKFALSPLDGRGRGEGGLNLLA